MDNNKTATLRMSETIKTPDGSYDLQFRVSIRSGATAEMMAETVSHFIAAALNVAEGELNIRAPGWTERSEYDLSEHGQNRVVIFGDIRVYTASGMKLFPVNVFSETTAAQDFVNFVWMVMGGIGQVVKLPGDIKFLGNINSTPQPKPQQQAPKPKSALDEAFPRNADGKPANTSTPPPTQDANVVVLNGWRGSEREELEKEHTGKQIQIPVAAIERDVKVFDNGNQKEFIHFFPTFQGGAGEWPIHYKLDIDMSKDWDVSNAKKSGLIELVPDIGMRRKVSGVATYRITADKRDGNNPKGVPYANIRYWNFVGFVAVEPTKAEQEQADYEASPESDGHIPF